MKSEFKRGARRIVGDCPKFEFIFGSFILSRDITKEEMKGYWDDPHHEGDLMVYHHNECKRCNHK